MTFGHHHYSHYRQGGGNDLNFVVGFLVGIAVGAVAFTVLFVVAYYNL